MVLYYIKHEPRIRKPKIIQPEFLWILVYIDIFMTSLLKQISSLIIHFSIHTENQIFLWSVHGSCLSPVLNDLATLSAESDSHAAFSHLTGSSIAGDLIFLEAVYAFSYRTKMW